MSVRTFDMQSLQDILIDAAAFEERKEIHSSESSRVVSEVEEEEDDEDGRGSENEQPDNYDEDFEEESPAKCNNISLSEEGNYALSPSYNNIENDGLFTPSPPKKDSIIEFGNDQLTLSNESVHSNISPRAMRLVNAESVKNSPERPKPNESGGLLPQENARESIRSRAEIPQKFTAISIKSNHCHSSFYSRVSPVPDFKSSDRTLSDKKNLGNQNDEERIRSIVLKVIEEKEGAQTQSLHKSHAVPIPARRPIEAQKATFHIPNYDRYYEICIELQELVRQERERDNELRKKMATRPLSPTQPVVEPPPPPASHPSDVPSKVVEDTTSRSHNAVSDPEHVLLRKPSALLHKTDRHRRNSVQPPFVVGRLRKNTPSKPIRSNWNPASHAPSNPNRDRLFHYLNPTISRNAQVARVTDRSGPSFASSSSSSSLSPSSSRRRYSVQRSMATQTLANAEDPSIPEDSSSPAEAMRRGSKEEREALRRMLNREQPVVVETCDRIYASFLSDLIGIGIRPLDLLYDDISLSPQLFAVEERAATPR